MNIMAYLRIWIKSATTSLVDSRPSCFVIDGTGIISYTSVFYYIKSHAYGGAAYSVYWLAKNYKAPSSNFDITKYLSFTAGSSY